MTTPTIIMRNRGALTARHAVLTRGGVALQVAIRHPKAVNRLAAVSCAFFLLADKLCTLSRHA